MKVLLQRVRRGSVSVGNHLLAEIGQGIVLLVGVGRGDTAREALWLADKCAHLRIFEDSQGKMNLSVLDVQGSALVVSQFTLYADTEKGRRPSFVGAGAPNIAEPLVRRFAEAIETHGVPIQRGKFGAHMIVEIENDGPVTILLQRSPSIS